MNFLRPVRTFLRRDRSGAVAIAFALTAIPLILVIGGAIDYSNVKGKKSILTQALDFAVLSAARNAQESPGYLRNLLDANPRLATLSIINTSLTKTTASDGSYVYSGDARASASTTFLKIVGLNSITVGAHSEATAPVHVATVTFTPLNTQGAWSKDIFVWTKDATGAVTSKQTVLTYRYSSSTGLMTTTPTIGTQTVTFSVPPYTSFGLGMVAYQDPSYAGALVNPVETWSDAANASSFLLQSGSCGSTAGATYNWEDGGDANFLDFVYSMKCTTGVAPNMPVRLTK